MAWFTAGIVNDPTLGQILADTGALAAQTISGNVLVYSTVATTLTLRHRNATNTADLHSQKIAVSTENNNFVNIQIGAIALALNERVTVTADVGFTGQIQVSLLG
jgi:hypothetical protein